MIFIFDNMSFTIFIGPEKYIHKYPVDKICRQIKNKYLLQFQCKNTIIFFKGFMFNVCNPTHDFLTQILNFF